MPTSTTPSRVLRATTAFPFKNAAGEEVIVHGDNVHRVLADASDAELVTLAQQGWIVLADAALADTAALEG